MNNKLKIIAVALAASCATTVTAANWGYDGQAGVATPADWNTIAPACSTITSTTSQQSPINIITGDVADSTVVVAPHYKPDDVTLTNNGHTVNVNTKRSLEFDHKIYRLEQFHFHTKSEHTIDGQFFDMEMHFVNKQYTNGALVDATVIGLLIKEGAENAQLKDIFAHLPAGGHDAAAGGGDQLSQIASDLSELIPDNRKAYHYRGSLTTPGCNEIVNWFLLTTPIEMSAAQIAAFRDLFKEGTVHYDTNRPVQPLNGRVVKYAKVEIADSAPGHGQEESKSDDGGSMGWLLFALGLAGIRRFKK